MKEWFYIHSGKQNGPITEQDLIDKLEREELTNDDKVWKEGLPEWVLADQRHSTANNEVEEVKEVLDDARLKVLKRVVTGCVLTCIMNPLAGFAFVYYLQAKNAFLDGRREDMESKINKGIELGLFAFLISLYGYFMLLGFPLLRCD